MAEISVLMAVYQSEKAEFLDRSLKSVWDDQILKPQKIVLVQDGPIGEELSLVLKKWKKKLRHDINIICNETNIGLTQSLIKGIKHINTEYIARMDSDDISLPERFAKQVEVLDSNPEIVVVGSDIIEYSDTDGDLGIRKYPRNTQEAKKTIYKANPLAHPVVMMRKNLFDIGLNYPSKYRTTQDLALWFDVLSNGYEIYNINEPLLRFRRNDDIYHRRANIQDSWLELKIHEKGILKLYGIAPYKSLFPIARFILRLLPNSCIKFFYNGKWRERVVK